MGKDGSIRWMEWTESKARPESTHRSAQARMRANIDCSQIRMHAKTEHGMGSTVFSVQHRRSVPTECDGRMHAHPETSIATHQRAKRRV
eukprot:scaffold633_cov321-Pavlova_lutheri.AAC.34